MKIHISENGRVYIDDKHSGTLKDIHSGTIYQSLRNPDGQFVLLGLHSRKEKHHDRLKDCVNAIEWMEIPGGKFLTNFDPTLIENSTRLNKFARKLNKQHGTDDKLV